MKSVNKAFIFQYDPYFSPKRMFGEFKEAIKGKKYIQPENVMVSNDLVVIHRIISKARLKVFAGIKEYQPKNIPELAQLLQRDYANVWRDCQVLANLGVIKLKKGEKEAKSNQRSKEVRPVTLYDRVVFDFPNREVFQQKNGKIVLAVSR